jgi:hypothetical protein
VAYINKALDVRNDLAVSLCVSKRLTERTVKPPSLNAEAFLGIVTACNASAGRKAVTAVVPDAPGVANVLSRSSKRVKRGRILSNLRSPEDTYRIPDRDGLSAAGLSRRTRWSYPEVRSPHRVVAKR